MDFGSAEQRNLITAIADYLGQRRPGKELRVPNPRATLVIDFRPGNFVFRVLAPVRGTGLRVTTISQSSHPELSRFLGRVMTGRVPKIDDTLEPALEEVGLIVEEKQVAAPVLFSCRLQDARIAAEPTDAAPLKLNSVLTLWPKAEAASLAPESLRGCALLEGYDILWVVDPARRISLPYWLNQQEAAIIRSLISGDRTIASLEAHLRGALIASGVLVSGRERPSWTETIGGARKQLARSKYAIVRDLLQPAFIRAVRDYCRRLIANGYMSFEHKLQRHILHNEPFARWLHAQTLPLLSEIIPEPVKPSYTYLAFYVAGACLDKHTDREQCEYTLSLTLDATPDDSCAGAWPLYLERPEETVEALLAAGDGVIFRGRELPHFRYALPPGRTSGSILLHYIPVIFPGPLS